MDGKERKDNVPEKIDLESILGPEAGGSEESGEVEVLDPATGRPAAPAREPAEEEAGEDAGKYHDLWIRARADLENFRKRIERERAEERAQAGAGIARELLPILDNLERALAGSPEGDPFRDGVALIHKQMKEALERAGLEGIEALGEEFNPVYHEAVATEATDKFEPNRILDEIRKGYCFRGRVLRPSLVRVSVAAQKPEGDGGNEAAHAGDGPAGDP